MAKLSYFDIISLENMITTKKSFFTIICELHLQHAFDTIHTRSNSDFDVKCAPI